MCNARPGSCFEGQAGVDACAPDLCSATSEGPLCGECKWEHPHSYMKDERCYRCKGGDTAAVISVLVLCILGPVIVAFLLYRFAQARTFSYRLYRRVFDIGRFKVRSLSGIVYERIQVYATHFATGSVRTRHTIRGRGWRL